MTEYASQGDPKRSMELSLGAAQAPTRGPKPGLDVTTIVAAAIELADAEGLGRRPCAGSVERLDKSAMALYTYVPGKAELLDLMLDTVYRELAANLLARRRLAPRGGGIGVRHVALYARHPWVLQVAGTRALPGPGELDLDESQLRLFDGLGLTAVDVMRAVGVVSGFVRGAAKALSDAAQRRAGDRRQRRRLGNARSPYLDQLPADVWTKRYPTIAKLSEKHAFDQLDRPDDETPYMVQDALDTFEFGLQRLLDGLESYIGSRQH